MAEDRPYLLKIASRSAVTANPEFRTHVLPTKLNEVGSHWAQVSPVWYFIQPRMLL